MSKQQTLIKDMTDREIQEKILARLTDIEGHQSFISWVVRAGLILSIIGAVIFFIAGIH